MNGDSLLHQSWFLILTFYNCVDFLRASYGPSRGSKRKRSKGVLPLMLPWTRFPTPQAASREVFPATLSACLYWLLLLDRSLQDSVAYNNKHLYLLQIPGATRAVFVQACSVGWIV